VADGSFAAWRGSAVTVAGTWDDGDASVQRDLPTLKDFSGWTGDLDVAVGGTVLDSGESYAQAAQGAYVDRWTAMAQNLQAARGTSPGTTYVRPFHEFNGDWYKGWFVTPQNVQDYQKAFRLMAQTIRAACPQCKIVWSPNNGSSSGAAPIAEAYPGDEWVDVIGVDSYNANGNVIVTNDQTWTEYANATDGTNPVGPEAWRQFAQQHGKPISFPEWGLNHGSGGGDNPAYVQHMHDWMAEHAAAPGDGDVAGKVVYDVYFNVAPDGNTGFLIKDGPNPLSAQAYTSVRWGNTDGAAPAPAGAAPASPQPSPQPGQQPSPQPSPQAGPQVQPPAPTDVRLGPVGVTGDAQTLANVPYATTSASQRLDLHLPRRTGTAVPVVLVIHGGAFSGGGKDDTDVQAAVRALVDHGYAAAAVEYRLSGEAPFPAGLQDVKAATRWLRAHAGTYGLDPGRFAAWGTSAGGYLATMLGVTGGQANPVLDDPALGSTGVRSAVQAVVSLYGPSDFGTMDDQLGTAGCDASTRTHREAGSPESQWLGAPVATSPNADAANAIKWIASAPAGTLPPFLLGHGSADCTVPVGQSVELSDALKRAGTTVQLQVVNGAGHGGPEIDDGLLAPAVDFLTKQLAAPATANLAPPTSQPTGPQAAPTAGTAPATGAPVPPAAVTAAPTVEQTAPAAARRTGSAPASEAPPAVRSSGS